MGKYKIPTTIKEVIEEEKIQEKESIELPENLKKPPLVLIDELYWPAKQMFKQAERVRKLKQLIKIFLICLVTTIIIIIIQIMR